MQSVLDGGAGGGGGGGGARTQGERRARRRCWLHAAALVTGSTMVAVGATLAFLWPEVFTHILKKELALSPSSTSFRMWKETPVPVYLKFFFFNWTNPEEMEGADDDDQQDRRPHLVECGPYVFREVQEKLDVQWNRNSTVSFRRARRWIFDPEQSRGTLSDNITTLNVVALTAAFHTRSWGLLMRKSLSLSMATLGQRVYETHTVAETLFEGFSSPLLVLARTFPGLVDIPYDRFGWFYGRNGSAEHDGLFTMHTGADDLAQLGRLQRWNGAARTAFFGGPCGLVNGSAGDLFPPGQRRQRPVAMFSPDLCRSIDYSYARDTVVHGVQGYQYEVGASLLDNAEPCFCGGAGSGEGQCVPPGALNVSSCRLGAPAFVSFPHYYLADQSYLQAVRGMSPDHRHHSNYITLEPTTGIPLEVAARFQINILLQEYPSIGLLKGVPKIFFPMLWFEETVTMTPEIAHSLKMLLLLPTGGVIMAIGVVIAGTVVIAATLLCWMKANIRWQLNGHIGHKGDIPLKSGAVGSGGDGAAGRAADESEPLRRRA